METRIDSKYRQYVRADVMRNVPTVTSEMVSHTGYTVNFEFTYQLTSAGPKVVRHRAPAVQISKAATAGTV